MGRSNSRCNSKPQEIPPHVEGIETLDETEEVGSLLIIEDYAVNDRRGFLFFAIVMINQDKLSTLSLGSQVLKAYIGEILYLGQNYSQRTVFV